MYIKGIPQHGIGSSIRRAPDGWKVVPRGNLSLHKLSWTTSCLSSSTVLCLAQQWDNYTNEVGQCHSSDIHQQAREDELPAPLSACTDNLGLMHKEECVSGSRTPTRVPRKDNITADRESRSTKDCCDWMLNLQVFQQIQLLMGPLQTDLFAFRLMKQLPNFYSWRPDPEATVTDAFNQDWAQTIGNLPSPMVLDST